MEACERLLEYVVDEEDKNTVESEITEVIEIKSLLEQNQANSTTSDFIATGEYITCAVSLFYKAVMND